MKVNIKKLHPDAIMPTYGTQGAACFDLYAAEETTFYFNAKVRTGLAFEVPKGHALMVYSRSGHGAKGIRLSNSVGVIDSDYRGEVLVMLDKQDSADFSLHKVSQGDRIAQGMIVPVDQVQFEFVDYLSMTDRGDGGFGSTGA